jgi:hypothetical protein
MIAVSYSLHDFQPLTWAALFNASRRFFWRAARVVSFHAGLWVRFLVVFIIRLVHEGAYAIGKLDFSFPHGCAESVFAIFPDSTYFMRWTDAIKSYHVAFYQNAATQEAAHLWFDYVGLPISFSHDYVLSVTLASFYLSPCTFLYRPSRREYRHEASAGGIATVHGVL